VHGIETVITTANSAMRGGADNPETVEHQGNQHLIDAAAAAGVRQFIFVSALGADPASPVPLLAGKGKAEQHLRASGLRHTILEPNLFMDVWLGMLFGMAIAQSRSPTVVGDGRRKHSFIAQDDVRPPSATRRRSEKHSCSAVRSQFRSARWRASTRKSSAIRWR
jgi:NADH dehydrogenase